MLRFMLAQHPEIYCGGEEFGPVSVKKKDASDIQENPQKHIDKIWNSGKNCFNIHDDEPYPCKGMPIHHALAQTPDVKIIYLSRENKWDQTLSLCVAQRTEKWVIRKGNDNTRQPIRLYPPDVAKTWHVISNPRSRDWVYKILSGSPSIGITYEQLCEHRHTTLMKIWNFLGVEPFDIEPDTEKVVPVPYNQFIENYDEIVDYVLRGMTGFPWQEYTSC